MQMPSPVSSASPSRQRLTALGALFPAKVARLPANNKPRLPGPSAPNRRVASRLNAVICIRELNAIQIDSITSYKPLGRQEFSSPEARLGRATENA